MKNKLTAGAFFLMLAVFVCILLLPADEESVASENRVMSTMPPINKHTAFSGEFAEGVESFIGDNIGFRSFFTGLSRDMESSKGITLSTGRIISTNKDIGTGTVQKQTLLAVDNTVMEMFMRDFDMERKYADAVNLYDEKLPENTTLYSMLIPTQLEFREPIYKNLQDSQKDAIDAVYGYLNSDVITVDAYSELEAHKDEYIYLRTDHHWTQLGAYYGYRAFMEASGGTAVNKDDFKTNKIRNVLGYLYDMADIPKLAENPDTIEWYDIDPEKHITTAMHDINEKGELTEYNGVMYDRTKADYLFFFGSDHPIVEMTNSDNEGGKTLAVLKDSYTNVLAPWLIKSYYKVILIDPRIYSAGMDKIIENFAPDEILVVNYIFTINFEDYCNLMTGLY